MAKLVMGQQRHHLDLVVVFALAKTPPVKRVEPVSTLRRRTRRRPAQTRRPPPKCTTTYRGMMLGDVVNGVRGKTAGEWAARQTYIALGNLMTSAAVLGVDACPMEGLVPAEYDKLLGLADSGYATVVACALGYRAANDKYAGLAKVRYEMADVVRVV